MSECLVYCHFDLLREEWTYRFADNPEAQHTFESVVMVDPFAPHERWLQDTAIYLGHALPIHMTMLYENGETVVTYYRYFQ